MWCYHPILHPLITLAPVTGLFFPHRYIDTGCSYIRRGSVSRGGGKEDVLLLLVGALVLTVSIYVCKGVRSRTAEGHDIHVAFTHISIVYTIYLIYTTHAYSTHSIHIQYTYTHTI